MSLSGKWLALRRKVDEIGRVGAIRLALRTLWQALFQRDEILFTLDLRGFSPPPTAGAAGASLRRIGAVADLSAADLAALRDYGGDGYLDAARARLEAAWTFFLVDLDGRAAGGGWALTPATGLAAKVVPIVDGELVIIDCFTFPACRGRNAYPHMLAGVAEHHRDAGDQRAWIFTRGHNRASIRGIEKAGFRPTMIYQTLTLCGREIVWWKRRAKGE